MPKLLVAFVVLLAAASCRGTRDADGHYKVRGHVESVSGEGEDARAVIHHERIADFKDRDGKPSPMDSMAMSFSIGPGVDASALRAGANVSIEFDVRWSRGDPLLITKATPLPDGTALDLPAEKHQH
jgi:hypothetical protein